MPILIQAQHRPLRHERSSHLDFPGENAGYYVVPPSGVLKGPTLFGYVNYAAQTQVIRPASMLQAVSFNDDPDGRARVVRLRPVDESEDSW
jgi:hypothetical protein